MNTILYKPEDIIKSFNTLFDNLSEQDILDNEAKLIMFRFLDIVERKREEMGWTRKQLAEQIGTSASYVTQLYRGDKLANIPLIAKIQMKLGIHFEISERESYDEQIAVHTEYYKPDKYGYWIYKKFNPQYDTDNTLPHIEPEGKAA
jgi:transcriptional regulator with XRE-family HTH domain